MRIGNVFVHFYFVFVLKFKNHLDV